MLALGLLARRERAHESRQRSEHQNRESQPSVHHLVSTVSGRLAAGTDLAGVLRAVFPGGSITGAPKVRAMEIIAELEGAARGVYTGALGLFDPRGDCELALPIRTAVVRGGLVTYQAGGGIVADSDPAFEYEETLNKAAALLRGVLAAERAARPTRQVQASAARSAITQEVSAT